MSLETWSRSRDMSRNPFFWSIEGVMSRLGLEGFRSRSRALRLETLNKLFLGSFARSSLKNGFKNDCSKFNRLKRSVAKLSLLLCYLRGGENHLPSTPFEIYTDFNTKCVCTNETAAQNLCNEKLGVLC